MATASRRADPGLTASAFALPPQELRQFDPLQLVRLWNRQGGPGATRRPVRFRADLGAGFPGQRMLKAVVEAADQVGGDDPPKGQECLAIHTADFCVASAIGPVPEPFVDWLRDEEARGRTAMRDFLDLFNQRVNLLRLGMRAQFEPGLNTLPPEQTAMARWVASLMGLHGLHGLHGPGGLHAGNGAGAQGAAPRRPPSALPPRSLLGIGGLLAGARRSASGLKQVLTAHLGCPVQVRQWVGHWRPIEPADRHRLGVGGRRLGLDTLLGTRVRDAQGRVRLIVGPLPFARAQRLLPALGHSPDGPGELPATGSLHEAVCGLVMLMLDKRQDAEMDVGVLAPTVPASRLTARPGGAEGALPGLRLGMTSWLQRDAGDGPHVMRLLIQAHAGGDS